MVKRTLSDPCYFFDMLWSGLVGSGLEEAGFKTVVRGPMGPAEDTVGVRRSVLKIAINTARIQQ